MRDRATAQKSPPKLRAFSSDPNDGQLAPRSKTVLVADDDVTLGRALARHLARSGWRVLSASNGKEALLLLGSEDISLVISDDQMPDLTGRQLFRSLRLSHPKIGRILMTGFPSLEAAMGALNEQEAHRYLAKPFELGALDRAIEHTIETLDGRPPSAPALRPAEVRRQELLAALEQEHPGLTQIDDAVVRPRLSAQGAEMIALAQQGRLSMESSSAISTAAIAATGGLLGAIDQLLLLLHACPRHVVILEPYPSEVRVLIDSASSIYALASLPNELGDAIAARLALLAGLDLSVAGHQHGEISVVHEEVGVDMTVDLRTSASGLAVEVRRLNDAVDAPLPPNGDDGFGPYRVGEVLGEGGLGVVFRGLHVHLDRPVAIKVMRHSASNDPVAAARLLREARAASRARSEGVVEVLDYGRLSDDRPFIVMELVAWPTLEWLLTPGALPVEQAVTIARNIALAMGAAHDAGVVHRDLKPSNIFVDEQQRVKIADFGAAKMLNDAGPALTSDGMTIGTPYYMSPEQARGQGVDRRSDIYSIGCVLFEMLAGSPPFEGKDSLDVVTKHVLTAPPTVTSPHAPLSLALVRTVARALSKQRAERHQTAQELVGDLDQALVSLRRRGWRKWLQ